MSYYLGCLFAAIIPLSLISISKNTIMERFHQLRIDKVLTTFNLNPIRKCKKLDEFTAATGELNGVEVSILEMALDRYEMLGQGWNEEELKMHFISPIIAVANPNIEKICKTFFERPLSGVINNYELNVVTDCMIASYDVGGQPKNPYFFLQEFKQAQRFGKTDPQGQMLVAMLLAQAQNADGKHLYGCYVIERHWYFTTLLGSDYCVSSAYDATRKNELQQIVFILRKLKELISERAN